MCTNIYINSKKTSNLAFSFKEQKINCIVYTSRILIILQGLILKLDQINGAQSGSTLMNLLTHELIYMPKSLHYLTNAKKVHIFKTFLRLHSNDSIFNE